MKRYIICDELNDIVHEFEMPAYGGEYHFKALFAKNVGYTLYMEQETIEAPVQPTGSRDETDNTSGKDSVQPFTGNLDEDTPF